MSNDARKVDLVQGTPEWIAYRMGKFNASEAAIMLGIIPGIDRLVAEKVTGVTQEPSPELQRVFALGHKSERLARPVAEELLGEELYPEVYEMGNLSCSLDGITLDGKVIWEHKLLNEEIKQALMVGIVLPKYMPQIQQCLFITSAEYCLFMASTDGTDAMSTKVYPDEAWFERILKGWDRFEGLMQDYKPEFEPTKAIAVRELPDFDIRITGASVLSNLQECKSRLIAQINQINKDLRTDEDFASASDDVKWLKGVEQSIADAKKLALAKTEQLDLLFKMLDQMSNQARNLRLELDKLVTQQKEVLRWNALKECKDAVDDMYREYDQVLYPLTFPRVPDKFSAAIHGKKSIRIVNEALERELSEHKDKLESQFQNCIANRMTFEALPDQHKLYFTDLQANIAFAPEFFDWYVKCRIAEHTPKIEAEIIQPELETDAEADMGPESSRNYEMTLDEKIDLFAVEKAKKYGPNQKFIVPIVQDWENWKVINYEV